MTRVADRAVRAGSTAEVILSAGGSHDAERHVLVGL